MRLVLLSPLILLSIAFADSNLAVLTTEFQSRVLAQVSSYKKRPQKIKKPRWVTYKSIRSAKYKGYKVTQIPEYQIPPLLSREDLNKIVPTNVTKATPSSEVLKKMGDKAVNVWLKSPSMQQVSLVQSVQRVEKAMNAEVELAPTDSDIKHKLNFQVQAFQTTSKIDYTGFVDATVSYNVKDHKTGYEVRRKVLHNKDFFVNHSTGKEEKLSSVGLKWSF